MPSFMFEHDHIRWPLLQIITLGDVLSEQRPRHTPGSGESDRAFRLDGQVALITGASRGIGAGIARAFVEAGAEVALVARSQPALEHQAGQLRQEHGLRVSVIAADLSDIRAVPALVEKVLEEHERLDILVNNAGGTMPTPLTATDAGRLEAAFRFNVSAPLALTKAALPSLTASQRASVINISSMMDRFAARDHLDYATVKAALSHMTRQLGIELAPLVRVNAIAPSIVETEGLRAVLARSERERLAAATPLQRLATVEDVAHAARWLASPASAFVTAQVLAIDGGIQGPIIPAPIATV